LTVLGATVPAALMVSLGTANLLAYLVLVVIAVFLISGPAIIYIYYRKHKKEAAVAPTQPSSA